MTNSEGAVSSAAATVPRSVQSSSSLLRHWRRLAEDLARLFVEHANTEFLDYTQRCLMQGFEAILLNAGWRSAYSLNCVINLAFMHLIGDAVMSAAASSPALRFDLRNVRECPGESAVRWLRPGPVR